MHRERTPKHQGEIASLRKELLILCWDIVAQAGRNLLAKEETGLDPWVGRTPWRRAWQPTPVFLPGKSHGQRSLAGYSTRGRKDLDTTERRSLSLFFMAD